jgi:oxygen-independent coproporphyrinogen-3 oxidase
MLSHEHFVMLMERIGDLFDLDERAEIAVEGDPRTLDDECVRMLVDGGVNRVSFGVQDFNLHVQEAIGRIQSFEMTRDVTQRLWDAGIKDINFDLMYGLPRQSTEDVMRSMEMATRIGPQRIALFGYAHVPWFKSHQRLIRESDLPDQHARFEQTEAAAQELVRLGYVRIGLDHFARPEDDMAMALANGTLRRNFQGYTTDPADAMLPFGASSIGQLPQGYIQNITDIGNWKRKVESGELSTARGLEFSADDKLRGEVIEKIMCNLAVDLEAVCAAHGVEADYFTDELAQIDELARDGLVVRDGLKLTVPEEHRAFIRIVSAVFDAYLKTAQAKHSVAV